MSTLEESSTLAHLLAGGTAERLDRVAAERAADYASADPFPHAVIEELLPEQILDRVVEEFPGPNQKRWIDYDNGNERKLAYPVAEQLPDAIRDVLYFLNSPVVLRFLESLTGIKGLIPDPYYTGGGLHQIEPGGFLGIHADFNKYERLDLDRRLNLLLYLNKDWDESYGGHLELWDESMASCVTKVLPVFNRCVVFSTTSTAYHGHPTPLACPPGRTRRSIATYYYTNGRPEDERAEAHSTLFRERPGAPKLRASRAGTAKRLARQLLPPIVTDTIHRLKNRDEK